MQGESRQEGIDRTEEKAGKQTRMKVGNKAVWKEERLAGWLVRQVGWQARCYRAAACMMRRADR